MYKTQAKPTTEGGGGGTLQGRRGGSYALSACSAWFRGITLRLRPRLMPAPVPPVAVLAGDDGPVPTPELGMTVGLSASRHLRKTLFRSRGMPSSTTVETGTNGRSSMPAARIAYSCAKSSALWNEAYCACDCARAPTTTYISKKASST